MSDICYSITMVAHVGLFLLALVVLFNRRHPGLAGCLLVVSTLLPIAGLTWYTDSQTRLIGLLLFVEMPVAACALLARIIVSIIHRHLGTRSR